MADTVDGYRRVSIRLLCQSSVIATKGMAMPPSFKRRLLVGRTADFHNTSPVLLIPHHDSFPLQEGSWIYQLTARWQENDYNGTANYAFRIDRTN